MRLLIFSFILILPMSLFAANSGIDTKELQVKVYKVAISTSKLCTDLTTVLSLSSSEAEYVDFFDSPTLGSGQVPLGSYPCVVIEIDDNLKFLPAEDSDDGSCVASSSTLQTLNVCGSGDTSTLIDGTSVSCTEGSDRVALYLSTGSTWTGGDGSAFEAPTSDNDADRGIKLANALTIAAGTTAKFIADGTGQVKDENSTCDMGPPAFSFEVE